MSTAAASRFTPKNLNYAWELLASSVVFSVRLTLREKSSITSYANPYFTFSKQFSTFSFYVAERYLYLSLDLRL
jgi:hypothetical protein